MTRLRLFAPLAFLALLGACAGARRAVNTRERLGPYSEAVITRDLVFLSGQLGITPASGALAEGVEAQTRRALENLSAVARAAGAKLRDAVRVEIYLADIDDYAALNAVYATFFPTDPPARTCVEVRDLPLHALVEIAATIAR